MYTDTLPHILTYIILYSFIGWVLETISKSFEEKRFVNSGFLNGPICPIYGLGAIIMLLTLSGLKDSILLLFLASLVILTVWEYVVGIFLEKVFKTKYWDYSHLKFNFQGRVCLKNSIYWGILGVIFIKFAHPFVAEIISTLPQWHLKYVLTIIYSVLIVDMIYSINTVITLDKSIEKINELSDTIKIKIEELKNIKANKQTLKPSVENVENIITELKIQETKLKIRIYRQTRRLKSAFPTMKSDTITKFLNQKVDFETLKKIIKKKE